MCPGRCRCRPGIWSPSPKGLALSAMLIGYARVSTEEQDLTAQRDELTALDVDPAKVYVDHGLTGANR